MTLIRAWILGERDAGNELPIMEDFPHALGAFQATDTMPPRFILWNGEPAVIASPGGADLVVFSRTVATEGIRAWSDRLGAVYPNSINAGIGDCKFDHSILGAINSKETAPSSGVLKYCIFAAQVINPEDETPAAINGMGFDEPMPGPRKLDVRDYLARWSLNDEATTWFTNNPSATPPQFFVRFAIYLMGLE
ncbi:MAG: hypothetical protein GY906_11545 [bacterium]|nr:hypothetical protein [bacterium]